MLFTPKIIPAIIVMLISNLAIAQKIFKGKVVDSATLQPIEFASIYSPFSGKYTETDKSGNFEISVPADTSAICISYPISKR